MTYLWPLIVLLRKLIVLQRVFKVFNNNLKVTTLLLEKAICMQTKFWWGKFSIWAFTHISLKGFNYLFQIQRHSSFVQALACKYCSSECFFVCFSSFYVKLHFPLVSETFAYWKSDYSGTILCFFNISVIKSKGIKRRFFQTVFL